jgi:hypothetical protein
VQAIIERDSTGELSLSGPAFGQFPAHSALRLQRDGQDRATIGTGHDGPQGLLMEIPLHQNPSNVFTQISRSH